MCLQRVVPVTNPSHLLILFKVKDQLDAGGRETLSNSKRQKWGESLATSHSCRDTRMHTGLSVLLKGVFVCHSSVYLNRSATKIYDCLFTFKPQQQPAERLIDLVWLRVHVCGWGVGGAEDRVFWSKHRSIFYVSRRGHRRRRIFTPLIKTKMSLLRSFAFV